MAGKRGGSWMIGDSKWRRRRRTTSRPVRRPRTTGNFIGGGFVPATGRQSAWNYLVFGLSKSSSLIMAVVVARLLTPADFGVFALAMLVANIFDYMKDLGVGLALVQRPGDWKRFAQPV